MRVCYRAATCPCAGSARRRWDAVPYAAQPLRKGSECISLRCVTPQPRGRWRAVCSLVIYVYLSFAWSIGRYSAENNSNNNKTRDGKAVSGCQVWLLGDTRPRLTPLSNLVRFNWYCKPQLTQGRCWSKTKHVFPWSRVRELHAHALPWVCRCVGVWVCGCACYENRVACRVHV